MEIEIRALLAYYAEVRIPYRRFGKTCLLHFQRSVLKEGNQRRYLCLNLMEIEICALLAYYAEVRIP
jgi:hypothetical protein